MAARKKRTIERHRRVAEAYALWLGSVEGKKARHQQRVEMFNRISDNELAHEEIQNKLRESVGSTKASKSHTHR
jgi:hypothetical protein